MTQKKICVIMYTSVDFLKLSWIIGPTQTHTACQKYLISCLSELSSRIKSFFSNQCSYDWQLWIMSFKPNVIFDSSFIKYIFLWVINEKISTYIIQMYGKLTQNGHDK